MKERKVSMEVKKVLHDGIIVLITYAGETKVWNESQRSRIQSVET